MVTALTMGFSLTNESFASGSLKEHYDSYWKQSVVQAVIAERIDSSATRDERAERFMIGLMLDIGKLAILKTAPSAYEEVHEVSQNQLRDVTDVEQEMFGFNHAHVGAELLSRWRLPESLVRSVRGHHASETTSPDEARDVQVAMFASAAGEYFCGSSKGESLERLNLIASHFFDLSEAGVQAFLGEAKDRLDSTCGLFAINPDAIPSPGDLLAEANDQLVMISLRTQQAQSEAEDKRRELEQKNYELREKSIRDPLTGLYTRRFFEELLGKELSRVKRTGRPVGLLFLDIDHFKHLNDTHGQQFGDRVLATVAQCIERASRDSDVVARFGGEEFVVLLTDVTIGNTEIVAERIRSAVESLELERNGICAPVTTSIGAASTKDPDDSPQALVGRADEMLYRSKNSGRNCVSVSQAACEANCT